MDSKYDDEPRRMMTEAEIQRQIVSRLKRSLAHRDDALAEAEKIIRQATHNPAFKIEELFERNQHEKT